MNKLSKLILALIFFSLFVPIIPAQAAGAAIFRLTSVKTDYYVGDNIYIDVMVEPNGESINTVRLISDFTGSGVLQINDFNLGTAWPFQSPGEELNNTTQHINVGGFILVSSVSTNSKFGTLIFRANAVGTSTINISTGSHLISPDQIERLDLAASQNITINVLGALPQPNQAPVFDPVGTKTIDLSQNVSFHVRANDPDGDNVVLTADIPADAVFSNITSGPVAEGDFIWTPTANGSYALKFYATDDNSQGVKIGSLTVNVNVSVPVPVANVAPIFQPVANRSVEIGQTVSFHVQATDPDGDLVNLTWTIPTGSTFINVVNNATIVSGDFSWTPDSQGVYTVTFLAEDNNPTEPKIRTLSVSIGVSVPPNHTPVFEAITEKTVNANDTLTFNVSATDPDGDQVILSMEKLESATLTPISNGVTSTSAFSWKPQNFGIYYAVFKALDDNLNPLESTKTVRITVFGGQCPPCSGGGGGIGNVCPIPQCQEQIFDKPLVKSLPIINSVTHPNQVSWYSNNMPKFTWDIAEQNLGYTFNLDQNPLSDPSVGYFFSEDRVFSFSELQDGFWYFHLKVKYSDGYGPTAHFAVKIDTTAPDLFLPSIEGNKIYFSAIDKYSGLAYFEIKLDDGQWQKIQSPYQLTEADKQGQILTLRAVDKAGNVIESRIDLPKMEVIKEEQKKYIINQPEFVVAVPVITQVEYPIVRGQSLAGAKIYLFISAEPQIIIYTLADYQGNWLAYIDPALTPGKYSVYAIANYNNLDSQPSEKVYFTAAETGIVPAGKFKFPFQWPSIPLNMDTLALLAGTVAAASLLLLGAIKGIKFVIKQIIYRIKDLWENFKLEGRVSEIQKKLKNYGRKKK